MPDQMLLDAFDRAVDILCIDPESYEYKTEVVLEFNAYWVWQYYSSLKYCRLFRQYFKENMSLII